MHDAKATAAAAPVHAAGATIVHQSAAFDALAHCHSDKASCTRTKLNTAAVLLHMPRTRNTPKQVRLAHLLALRELRPYVVAELIIQIARVRHGCCRCCCCRGADVRAACRRPPAVAVITGCELWGAPQQLAPIRLKEGASRAVWGAQEDEQRLEARAREDAEAWRRRRPLAASQQGT